MGPWVNHEHRFLSTIQMLYRLRYYCIWWTPLPGMITHLSAKRAKDGHQHLPAGLLPLVLGGWFGEEGRKHCYLFIYTILIHLVWILESEKPAPFLELVTEAPLAPFFSITSFHAAGATEATKAALQHCPAPPQLHTTTTQQMNELANSAVYANQPGPLRSLWWKWAITSPRPLVFCLL